MTNKDIEQRYTKAFSAATPDIFDAVLEECAKPRSDSPIIVPMFERKKPIWRKAISIAAAIAVILTAGFAGSILGSKKNVTLNPNQVDSVISFDVNPSIELKINTSEKVISAAALNEDAKEVLGNMKLEGSDLTVAVNAIIASLIRNGYIDELSNAILISVDNEDEQKGAELEKRLAKEISDLLSSENFDSKVISQTIKRSEEIARLAKEYGITSGKAQLIKQIIDKDSNYSFVNLSPLTINQLNRILSGEKLDVGKDSANANKDYISKSKAKKIALKKANLSEDQVSDFSSTMDIMDGKMVYEILFRYDKWEYRYTINAENGKIVKDKVSEIYLGFAEAKKIALERAGVTAEEITDYSISFKDEVYHLRFKIDIVEYRIRVDGILPEVIYSNPKIPENESVKWPTITEDQAKQIISYMLESGEVSDYKCEFTKNGVIPVYKITFKKPWIDSGSTVEQILDCTFIINAYNGDEIGVKKELISVETQTNDTSSEAATSTDSTPSQSQGGTEQNLAE